MLSRIKIVVLFYFLNRENKEGNYDLFSGILMRELILTLNKI